MRAFIAIDVPEDLMSFARDFEEPGVKILDNYHMTLKFFGEISEREIEGLIVKLKKIKVPEFHLHIADLGVFPSEEVINVAWVGLVDSGFLCELIKQVGLICGDEKNFKPHVTFARVKSLKNKKSFLEKIKKTQVSGTFEVKSFRLYESVLKLGKAEHKLIKEFKLV